MERSAIKSKNYAARLAMPLLHIEDGHWKNGSSFSFSYTIQYATLSLYCTGLLLYLGP